MPTSPVAGQQVSFSLDVSDPENDAVSCVVDFEDGQSQNLTSCAGVQNLSHTYTTEGQYTVKVTAKDATGALNTTSAYITVQDVTINKSPVINAFNKMPSNAFVADVFNFTWQVANAEDDNVSCRIDFGDNSFVSLPDCLTRTTYPCLLYTSPSPRD